MANNLDIATYRADTGNQFKPRTGFSNWARGNPELLRQLPRYSPEIAGNINELLGSSFQGLQNPSQGFQPIANEAIHRFETQGVPSLAERFTAMGGGQRSSAFQNALSSGRSDLERSLGAMQAQYGLQNRQGLMDQLKLGLMNQPSFDQVGREPGFFEGLLGPLLGGGKYRGNQSAGEVISLLTKLLPFFA